MARTFLTPANKTVSHTSDIELKKKSESSRNAGEPSNTNENNVTAAPNSHSGTDVLNANETGHTAQTNDNPIPTKSDEGTLRKRQMLAMIDIISKDHGKFI